MKPNGKSQTKWPGAKLWPLVKIKPYPNNARVHPEDQIALLAKMIAEHGPDQPIVVDEAGVILKGHGRLAAAVQIGLMSFPVVQRLGLNDAQKRAIRVADNKITEMGRWDDALLKVELTDLKALDFDLQSLGFQPVELDGFLNEVSPEAEIAPEPPKNPIVRRGDLWTLGEHRLLSGDATSADDVGRLLDGEKPHLMVTDPPYGINYDPTWRDRAGINRLGPAASGKIIADDRVDWREAWSLFDGSIAYIWHGSLFSPQVAESLQSCGFVLRSQIIWAKNVLVMGRGDYHPKHEPCWYAVRGKGNWTGDRKQTTVWEIASPLQIMSGSKEEKMEHPTQKPIECMKRPIENNSTRGDAIYDPFVGSGTTLIAAEMTERRCYAIEIEPAYCEVVIQRWQKFTGKQATLDGKTFEQVAKERSNARPKRKPASMGPARAGNGLSAGGLAAAAKS